MAYTDRMTDTTWQQTKAGKRWLLANGHRKRVKMTWLARARLLSGMSVAQAAKATGLNARTWEAWERIGEARRAPSGEAGGRIWLHFGPTLIGITLYSHPYVFVNPLTL